MRAIVVFESLWGNTEKVAQAIAHELALSMPVDVFDTDAAPRMLDDYDLVVVGGPTHAFSMSRPATREAGVQSNGAPHAPEHGIREWLDELAPPSRTMIAAAFDTRVESPRLPGSAAKAARNELRSRGFVVDAQAMSFRVHGYGGPLVDGELERAAGWARAILPHAVIA